MDIMELGVAHNAEIVWILSNVIMSMEFVWMVVTMVTKVINALQIATAVFMEKTVTASVDYVWKNPWHVTTLREPVLEVVNLDTKRQIVTQHVTVVGTAKSAVKNVENVLGQKTVNTSMEHAWMAAKVDTKD